MIYIQNSKGQVLKVTQEKWESLKRLGWDKKWDVIKQDPAEKEELIAIEVVRKPSKKEVKEQLETSEEI
jgi:hypothetical protein